jgi:glycerophosphoryl diester phosphodiesterase
MEKTAGKVKIYAHRGAQQGAPENSFAALKLASIAGAGYIEFDVQLTRDQRLVVIHDEKLTRTTGQPGRVCDKEYAELTQMDVGSWFSSSFCHEKMPGFEPWMEWILENNLIANIELKPNSSALMSEQENASGLAKKAVEYLAVQWPREKELRVSSFSLAVLRAVRARGYAGELAFLTRSYDKSHLPLLKELQVCAYHVNHKGIKASEIATLKKEGYEVFAYTIDKVEDAESFLASGGDGFFTNNLLLLDNLGSGFASH